MSVTLHRPVVSSVVSVALTRRRARHLAAALSVVIAGLYACIALGIAHVVETTTSGEELGIRLAFATPAAVVFFVGAFLLLRYDDRRLWLAGVVLQLLIIAMYISVGADREPAFEAWGIAIRVVQVLLLVPLTYLAVRKPPEVEA